PSQLADDEQSKMQAINPNDVRMWNEPFGKGSSGRVYKAIYLPLCQIVAAKVTSRLDTITVKQLLEEYEAQVHLLPVCQQLMQIYGWYRDMKNNEVVILLEYMDMGSVYDSCFPSARVDALNATPEEMERSGHKQISIESLSFDQLRFIAREVLLGLHHLHSQSKPLVNSRLFFFCFRFFHLIVCGQKKILKKEPPINNNNKKKVHGDIKPQNILLSCSGEVKIADFGLLRQLESPQDTCQSMEGTMKYFAPERANGSVQTLRTHLEKKKKKIFLIKLSQKQGVNFDNTHKIGYNKTEELLPDSDLDLFQIVNGINVENYIESSAPVEFVSFLKQCLVQDPAKRPNTFALLQYPFVTMHWGPVLPSLPISSKTQATHKANDFIVEFAVKEHDQNTLDKLLAWLEEWIMTPANAQIFEKGNPDDMKQCVRNLAKCSGYSPNYIDTYIEDVYRELLTK
ncbi:MAP kinase kinase, partial [Reticulomyxa filosa]